MDFPKAICVVGTHANVGKTFVASMLTLGLRGLYWKPIQCGVSPQTDTEDAKELTGLPQEHFLREAFLFQSNVSPLLESLPIEIEELVPEKLPEEYTTLIIESPEGLMMPLNEHQSFLDFLTRFHLPVLFVVKTEEKEISSTLLALEKIQERDLPLIGIALNGDPNSEFRHTLESLVSSAPIFEIPYLIKKSPDTLFDCYGKTFGDKLAIAS